MFQFYCTWCVPILLYMFVQDSWLQNLKKNNNYFPSLLPFPFSLLFSLALFGGCYYAALKLNLPSFLQATFPNLEMGNVWPKRSVQLSRIALTSTVLNLSCYLTSDLKNQHTVRGISNLLLLVLTAPESLSWCCFHVLQLQIPMYPVITIYQSQLSR